MPAGRRPIPAPTRYRGNGGTTRGVTHRSGPKPRNSDLPTECWCGATIVHVPPEIVRRCETYTCGTAQCEQARDRHLSLRA